MAEDVAVGPGMLVGDGDQGSQRRVGGIGGRSLPAPDVERDRPPRQLLEQELRHVAAAVPAHVDDQARAVDLVAICAMELGVAVRAHVGEVQIADLAAGLVADARAVRFDPVAIAQRRVVRQRGDRNLPAGAGASRAHGEYHLLAGLMDQKLGGRVLHADRSTADREQVVSFGDAHAGRAQR
jgi:hypothetical protein